MTSLPEDLSPLAGDDDRDTAVQRLQEAYSQGRISHEEMDERLDQALTARTQGALARSLASLPEPGAGAGTEATIGAATGRIRRSGAWRVPRTLKVASALGRVHLDLSRAIFEHPVVDIELQLGTGGARITVPHDAVVDIEGMHAGWKEARYKPPRHPTPGGPTIRISGTTGFGRLKVRHARR
ncbi:DUF1707 domain-containing protein [Kitasatospora sp. NPDC058243]|uniref:DUF1707 SHOCT-like domain-containing protein n=1 Tax=Kitasatospora sp. NPDC058243 TaxID=3346397 RepID=UPI0036D813BF